VKRFSLEGLAQDLSTTPTMGIPLPVTLAGIGGALYVGIQGTFVAGFQDGYFPFLGQLNNERPYQAPYHPPNPIPRYTGIKAVDDQLVILVGFFAAMFLDERPYETRLLLLWLFGQFAAIWTVLLLEGVRRGNRGKIISW
jgi:hypothetical protein